MACLLRTSKFYWRSASSVFAGSVLSGFSLALIVGIIVGTYSSVYVASSYALMLGVSRADLMPTKKEGEGLSTRP